MTRQAAARADRAFLRTCAVGRPEDWEDADRPTLDLPPAAWQRFVAQAGLHGFGGLAARNLEWARERLGVAAPILADLGRLRAGLMTQNLARKAAARRFAEALASRGIPFIAFKGVALAEEVYGDLSLRGFNDFDVMVPLERVEEAYAAALELRYRLTRLTDVREFMRLGAHAAGMTDPAGMSVDLHWSIAPGLGGKAQRELPWRHARPAPAGSRLPGLRLSPEMTLVHLAKHFHTAQYTMLKPLVDFHVAARRLDGAFDAEMMRALAGELGLRPELEIASALARRTLAPSGAALDGESTAARLALAFVPERLIVDASATSRITNWLRYLAASGSVAATVRSVGETLFPGRLLLAQFFDRPFSPHLYPRYYWRQVVKVLTLSTK